MISVFASPNFTISNERSWGWNLEELMLLRAGAELAKFKNKKELVALPSWVL